MCVCVFSSLCVPLHLGLHNGLHWDPSGGKWKSCVHSSGPRAAAGCVTGQCSHPCVNCSYAIYLMTYRTALGRLLTDSVFFFFPMFFNVPTLHNWSGCLSSLSSINLYYPGGKYGWQSPWLQSNNIGINHTEGWFKQTTVHLAEKKLTFFSASSSFESSICCLSAPLLLNISHVCCVWILIFLRPVFPPTVRHLLCFIGSSQLSLQLQFQRHQLPEFPTDAHRLWDARVPLAARRR